MRHADELIGGIALDSAGLVALADLSTIKQRTALMGSGCIFDILLLAPGIHTQQDATSVNGGELPQAGDMKNGYVFRIENPATVNYLQRVGKTGHLVTVSVEDPWRVGDLEQAGGPEQVNGSEAAGSPKPGDDLETARSLKNPDDSKAVNDHETVHGPEAIDVPELVNDLKTVQSPKNVDHSETVDPETVDDPENAGDPKGIDAAEQDDYEMVHDSNKRTTLMRHLSHLYIGGFLPSLLWAIGITLTIASIVILAVFQDFWAMGVLLMLVLARAINTVVVIRRTHMGWKGAREKDVLGDLLIILSQDRWIRMQGRLNDIKAVTAGYWLREQTSYESFASAFAMLLVYAAAALAINATTVGSLIIAVLLLLSAALLEVCNSTTRDMHVCGRRISVSHTGEKYPRRLLMLKKLAAEIGQKVWAVEMKLAKEADFLS